MQDHYNLIYREEEREMLPLCWQEGVAVIPWSPLARGRLTRPWGETTAGWSRMTWVKIYTMKAIKMMRK
ncbi:oxidoreductase [Salmonella enterica subsp. enterica]|uniref:Oxidoreductase n=1 Tax=Salmonella enterica I TaxID=59201 RepID=A0A379WZC3_SALET|nr:oxidoreductase [Salmonella enterica subsp. enterica]